MPAARFRYHVVLSDLANIVMPFCFRFVRSVSRVPRLGRIRSTVGRLALPSYRSGLWHGDRRRLVNYQWAAQEEMMDDAVPIEGEVLCNLEFMSGSLSGGHL